MNLSIHARDAVRKFLYRHIMGIGKKPIYLIAMKLTFFLIVAFCFQVSASAVAQRISLHLKDRPLEYVLDELQRQSGYAIIYNPEYLKAAKPVTVNVKDEAVEKTLSLIFANQPVGYTLEENVITIVPHRKRPATAVREQHVVQQGSFVRAFAEVRGRVVDSLGQPLAGASIRVLNAAGQRTTLQTTADTDGYFVLADVPDNAMLEVTYVGHIARQVRASADMGSIVLSAEPSDLDEVVVTALGINRSKRAVGYAVQEIGGEELAQTKDLNLVNSLSGKIAGVQVTNSSGAVGSSSRIIIRGNNSFGNNQPLFVVDGVPLMNNSTTVTASSGVDYGNGAADIDPNNIESVSVLKGANAAALYGSRAANGVILITTKKGAGSKLGIDVSSSFTVDDVYIMPRYQNEYGQGLYGSEYLWKQRQPQLSYQDYAKTYSYNYVDGRGGGVNDMIDESWGPRLDAGLRLDQFFGDDQHWVSHPNNVKSFFDTGITSDNNVSLTSAGERAFGRLSLSNLNVKGALPNTELYQNTVNFSGTLVPSSRFRAEMNVTYLKRYSDNLARGQYGSSENPFMSVGGWFGRQVDMGLLKKHWQDDDQHGNPYNWQQGVDNPYLASYKNTNAMDKDRVFGNVNATFDVNDWLSVKGVVGTDYYDEFRQDAVNSRSTRSRVGGSFGQTMIVSSETNADLMMLVKRDLSSTISIDGLVGANIRNNRYRSIWVNAGELTVPDLYTISNVKGNISSSTYYSEKETQSVYASANLSYNDYLFLSLTGRNDWSSTLPANNRSFFYPSANLSFVFTDGLDIRSGILSYGKVRAGWAQVGNDTDPYRTMATYAPSSSTWDGVTFYSYTRQIPPLNLKPEITTSFEVGTELRFWNDRLWFDATYYKMGTKNQIMSVDVSKATGFASSLINAGNIQNQGVEIQLGGRPVAHKDGLLWDVNVNWAANRNKVVELYPGIESLDLGPANNVIVQAMPGKPFGQIIGGAYQRDANGHIVVNAQGVPNVVSNQVLGNVLPKWTGGVNNTFRYKNMLLSFLVDMRWGGDFFSYTTWHNLANGTLPATTANGVRENGMIVDGVKEDGTANDTRISAEDYFRGGYVWDLHENSIVDGSYIKLREVVLGYTFQLNASKYIKNATFSLVGRNLALLYTHESNIAHIDPETGMGVGNNGLGVEIYQLPPTRSVGLKVQLGF